MIAMAIACNPRLLIADEPTTALDVTIQKQILDLLRDLQRERGMALILITHDMAVVGDTAQRVAGDVCRPARGEPPRRGGDEHAGASLHRGACSTRCPSAPPITAGSPTIPGVVPGIADRPQGCLFSPRCRFATDYTRMVRPGADAAVRRRRALPPAARCGRSARSRTMTALLEAEDIHRSYEVRHGPLRRRVRVRAVDGVSFTMQEAKTLAVVGESGCGKSTLARVVTLLEPPSEGRLLIDGAACRRGRQTSARCAARCRWCSRTRTAR